MTAEDSVRPADGSINRALLFMGLATFASVATMRVADPLLPQIAHDFSVTPGEAAIISSAFTIAYAFGQFVHGPIGDRFGKLRIIAWMTVLSALSVSAAGFVHSLPALGIVRFIAGSTAAAIVPLAMAFIGDHVDYHQRQTVLARFLSSTVFGVILGQAFGGLIGDWFGWRAVFPILGLIMFTAGILMLIELRRGRLPPPKLSKSLSLASLKDGYSILLHRPWVRIIILVVFIEGFFFYGAFTFIGADLHQRFGISYGTVGLILCIFGFGGLIYSLTVRQLVTRLGEQGLALAGGLLLAAGLTGIMLLPLVFMPIGMFVLGLGLYMIHNTLQTNATQMAPEARGLAVSTFANSLFLGQAVGVIGGGFIVDRFGFTLAYIFAAIGLAVLGILFSHLLGQHAKTS